MITFDLIQDKVECFERGSVRILVTLVMSKDASICYL
ncbi:DUF2536 family protein [Anoxybacillus kestanbolensis]|nr:DUF2536 family protein [Anoxybacillus kestanbolensis]